VHDVLRFDWQRADLLARQRVAEARIGGVDNRAFRDHGDGFRETADLEDRVLAGGRIDGQEDAFGERGLEAAQLDPHVVTARLHVDEPVSAVVIGHRVLR
jgi:hypothetical protein